MINKRIKLPEPLSMVQPNQRPRRTAFPIPFAKELRRSPLIYHLIAPAIAPGRPVRCICPPCRCRHRAG
ncbi:uncharacterized protein SCHCODRAFT_010265 [Schizophyllum commune H4-8]|uniref:Expressed protein n=1 Tax=Schizophyllum commune (strain H4-8 / FGSC 9210) TaxID=578458 RepID=D8PKT1_SCHCM|nr:uncharacterized protein SCHCODRAFT_010265 [Schizophyllum commune H4-8]KAI5897571.1 hypothetical protein SCHCODRAFT_010265 [Schizophyllum commune H4-8]